MAGQLIPPPELAPPPWPPAMPDEDRFDAWLGLVASGEDLVLAGIRDRVGEHGDWQAEFRRWYQMTEDDRLRHRIRRASELENRRIGHAE